MVAGIDSFRDKIRGFEDCYTVIGGAACDILMSEADIDFRLTKDIDMILILEDKKEEFAKNFWEYIKEGKYKCGWKNSDKMHFYRFTEPIDGYPVMIELFSRKPGYNLEVEEGIIPIHIDDDTSSLSAILLNDDYYNFMMEGRKVVNDIPVLDAEYLIPFKMYAWLDLTSRKARGEFVKEKDLKKHKYDVFRLMSIIDESATIKLSGLVKEKTAEFLEKIKEEPLSLDSIHAIHTKEDSIEILKAIYLSE
jgi:hypothetical protein